MHPSVTCLGVSASKWLMKRWIAAAACIFSITSVWAQGKVATVRLAEVFQQCPEVVECKAQVEKQTLALKDDVRAKAVAEKKAEIVGMNDEAKRLIVAYQKLAVKDDKAPESQNLREYRKRRNLAESQLQALKLEFEEFQKEQQLEINREMAKTYRAVLNRLTTLVNDYAREQGFDVVYDISGKSHVGLPVLLYAKPGMTVDITEAIQALVRKPAGETPKENPAPAGEASAGP